MTQPDNLYDTCGSCRNGAHERCYLPCACAHTTGQSVTIGDYTYARVDCDDDVWRYAIVTGYRDAQSYDRLIVAFADGYAPEDEATVNAILNAVQGL